MIPKRFYILIIIFVITALSANTVESYPADNEWIALRRNGVIIQDPNGDTNGSRNIVSDTTHAAAYFANDGTNIYFRLRLDADPTGQGGQGAYQPFGWGFELDTNLNPADYEYLIMLDGIRKDESLTVQRNTVQGILGDPSDKAEIISATYTPITSYSRVVLADTSFNGNQDYFLDFFVPYQALLSITGLTDNSPIRFFEGSSSSTMSLTENGADLVGASDLYSGFSDYVTPIGQTATTGQVKFVSALNGSGDVTQINAGDTIYLAVFDNDQNIHLNSVDTVTVVLKSGTTGDTETITLTETGPNTGIFTASIPSNLGAAVNGNGSLQVAYGDTLTVTYIDKVDANGNINQTRTDTATVINPIADFAVTKTVGNPTPNVGSTITYTIAVTNNGPNNGTGVAVTDNLPSSVTYVSNMASQGTYSNSTGIWTVGSLNNGVSATLTITVTVNTGTGGTTITNTASKTASDQSDPNTGNNTSSVSITIQSADIAVTKIVNNLTPNVGNTIIYTITATNNGPNTATGVEITDTLPSGITYVSHTASAGTTYSNATGKWTIVSLANGASATLTINATVNTGTGGTTITNTASKTSSDQSDPNTSNNTSSVSMTVQTADISIIKTADNAIPNIGGTVNYTITVTNNGPNAATGVVITDNLPSGVTYVLHTASQGTYTKSTGIWTLGNLSNEANAVLTLNVTVNTGTSGSTISNTATLTSLDQTDSNAGNNQASAPITVKGTDGIISITHTIIPGDTITVTVNDIDLNTNPTIAETIVVEVKNTVTGEIEQVTLTETGPNTGVFSGTLSTVPGLTAGIYNDGTMNTKAGDTITATYNDNLTSTGGSATVTDSCFVLSPLMSLTKVVDKASAPPEDILTYTITYKNIGDANARDINVIDPIPFNTEYVIGSATGIGVTITFQHIGGGAFDSSETLPVYAVRWTPNDPLLPNGSGTLIMKVKIK